TTTTTKKIPTRRPMAMRPARIGTSTSRLESPGVTVSIWYRIERRLEEFAGDLLPDEFRERLVRARQALKRGDLAEASALLNDLAEERPEHSGTRVLLGLAHLRLGRPELARDSFDA